MANVPNLPNKSTKFYMDKLSVLDGGKIIGVTFDPEDTGWPTQFFGLAIRMPNNVERFIWFLRDDEGNGPGSFDITDTQGKQI